MATLKYTIIKSKTQYKEYSKILEDLVMENSKGKEVRDEIELLTLLIEKWDDEHSSFNDVDPITLIHSLMEERNLKAKHLVEILGVSKGLVSDILNYKKGLSKEIIRALSDYFKVSQEAFNRPYKLSHGTLQKFVEKVKSGKIVPFKEKTEHARKNLKKARLVK